MNQSQVDHLPQYRNLVCDVLKIAIRDAVRNPLLINTEHLVDAAIARRNMANAWIESKSKKPQSFVWWCGLVGLSPFRLRRGIRALNEHLINSLK